MGKVTARIASVGAMVKAYFFDLAVNGLLASYLVPVHLRNFIFLCWTKGRVRGAIFGHCYVESSKLHLGKGSYINRSCMVCNKADWIEIGRCCSIAYGVAMHTTDHEYSNPLKRAGKVRGGKISIGDGCWIGADAIILLGVEIGPGSIIAAGSVVTAGRYESNCLYGGIPARFIKRLDDDDSKKKRSADRAVGDRG